MIEDLGRWMIMDWSDRLIWFAVGATLGYVIRLLQDIRREVHEVDEKVEYLKDDAGFVRIPIVLDALLILMIVATLYSVFRVEVSVDRADDAVTHIQQQQAEDVAQNERIDRVASCTLEYTAKTIRALNERTTFTGDRVDANVDVLRSQLEFLRVTLVLPPVPEGIRRDSLQEYVSDVDKYIAVSKRDREKAIKYAYPTNEELSSCLSDSSTSKQKENENDERKLGTTTD